VNVDVQVDCLAPARPHRERPIAAAGADPDRRRTHAGRLVRTETHPQGTPRSGVAWYLAAEAEDAAGHEGPARQALAKAERFAPGLPFANAQRVAALRAHLASGGRPSRHVPILPLVVIGALLLIGLVWLRGVMRLRRQRMGTIYPPGYGPGGYGMRPGPNAGPPPYYGSGGGMAGGWSGMGGGFGSMLFGGLAAGLGVGLGERMIDGIWGNRNVGDLNSPVAGNDMSNTQAPDRDDGLMGAPGWDGGDPNAWGNPDPSGGGGGGFDDDDGLSGGGGW
jgi:hypothetical protein